MWQPFQKLLFSNGKTKIILGIEPNEHRIPRFPGKCSYHTNHSENPGRPDSPNLLPMSQCFWGVAFFGLTGLSVSLKIRESSEIEMKLP